MSLPISKIHVNNTTTMSLNDRFTHLSSQQQAVRRSRSRSLSTGLQPVSPLTTLANQRLLQKLQKQEKLRAALRLKRKSLRTIGGNKLVKRGTIKSLRVGVNGKQFRANSLTQIATMRADFITNSRRPLRRINPAANIVDRIGGNQRPLVGGAAERIAKRRFENLRGRALMRNGTNGVQRGRSRSRTRIVEQMITNGRSRSRSRARVIEQTTTNGRSRSRQRNVVNVPPRTASRLRTDPNIGRAKRTSIQDRLGKRPGADKNIRRGLRSASVNRRTANGRIQKRRNVDVQVGVTGANNGGARVGRIRGRSVVRSNGGRGRSQSRGRKGTVGRQQGSGNIVRGRRRGRSQTRNGRQAGYQQNGNKSGNNNGQQQRRGRSRSRGRRGGQNSGNNAKSSINKDELDKQLDQYMSSTKTE